MSRPVVIRALEDVLEPLGRGTPLVVALSGGLDSCVLLHAVRFGLMSARGAGRELFAAHFDHGMRPESPADARWVAGVCRGWHVPLFEGVAERALTSEDDAREARYAFLESVARDAGRGSVVLTAHHADDQAETVLFRLVRGTGPDGLRAINARRAPGVMRPLLRVWREELERYAATTGLRWREDATNAHLGFARNALRHRIIPDLERTVAPGARRALVRISGLAATDAEAWDEALPFVLESLEVHRRLTGTTAGAVEIDRARLLELGSGLRARVIRSLAAEVGARLDRASVDRVDAFLADSSSARSVDLGGGCRVGIQLDHVVFSPASDDRTSLGAGPEGVLIPSTGEGAGHAVLQGRTVTVSWTSGQGDRGGGGVAHAFATDRVEFPLEVRARAPGDRVRTAAGMRKVKKVMLEQRIRPEARASVPVLVDGTGQVLWIPGVVRSTLARPEPGDSTLTIRIDG